MTRNREIPDRWHPSQKSSDSESQEHYLSRSLSPVPSALGTPVGSQGSDAPLKLKAEFNAKAEDDLPQKSPWRLNNLAVKDRGSRQSKQRSQH